MDTENLGTQISFPRCRGCKCGMCLIGNKNCTIKEDHELHLINEGLILNKEECKWTVKYP